VLDALCGAPANQMATALGAGAGAGAALGAMTGKPKGAWPGMARIIYFNL